MKSQSIASAQSYELVLMDIQMPKMDGLAASRLIRQWESERGLGLGHTPVIALTASVLEEDVRNAIAAGCDAHLSEPIKKLILLDAMRKATSLPRDDTRVSTKGANANVVIANGAAPAIREPLPIAS